MVFAQHAAGDFVVKTVPATSHCGRTSGNGHFRYCVDINYHSDAALDEHGFLLDNLDFQDYFDSLSDVKISCERMAQEAVNYFIGKLGPRISHAASIAVRIYPFGEVYVESRVTL